jgi:hypothetical protein
LCLSSNVVVNSWRALQVSGEWASGVNQSWKVASSAELLASITSGENVTASFPCRHAFCGPSSSRIVLAIGRGQKNHQKYTRKKKEKKNKKADTLVVAGSFSWMRWETISVLVPLIRVPKRLMTGRLSNWLTFSAQHIKSRRN